MPEKEPQMHQQPEMQQSQNVFVGKSLGEKKTRSIKIKVVHQQVASNTAFEILLRHSTEPEPETTSLSDITD